MVTVQTLTVGAFQENCYLVVDSRSGKAVIVDPGGEGERLVEAVDKSGATLEAVWITHAHVDHVGAIASIKQRWDVPVYLHPARPKTVRSSGSAGAGLWRAVRRAASARP